MWFSAFLASETRVPAAAGTRVLAARRRGGIQTRLPAAQRRRRMRLYPGAAGFWGGVRRLAAARRPGGVSFRAPRRPGCQPNTGHV